MKRYQSLILALLVTIGLWAQPSFRNPSEGPSREDFPKALDEQDKEPVNATFSFAIFSDTHISEDLPTNIEDLKRAIDEVNQRKDLAFVLVCGDITHNGDTKSLRLAKEMLDELSIPYYVVPGNHDMRASESACSGFASVFGDTRFRLFFNGYLFLGLNSGQLLRPNDAHVAPQDLNWLSYHLKQAGRKQPVYFIDHHPLISSDVDNWEAVTDLLRQYNVQGVFNGHYHRNATLSYDGIPGVVLRSTLRGDEAVGGYTIAEMADSLYFSEKKIGEPARRWYALATTEQYYTEGDAKLFPRPSYEINKKYKNAKTIWKKDLGIGTYGSACVADNKVYVGDESGMMRCFDAQKGKQLWQYKTSARIAAAPAVVDDKVIFGSANGLVIAMNKETGKLAWKQQTGLAVCAAPAVVDDVIFIGSGDKKMRAINVESGEVIWTNDQATGYIQSQACIYGDKVIYAAYDKHLYAVDKMTGNALWSPIELTDNVVSQPVVASEKVFVITADGNLQVVDANNGNLLYFQQNDSRFVASVGVSEDSARVYVRTQKGKLKALDATTSNYEPIWKQKELYKNDSNPCSVVEHNGRVAFATKNGLIIWLSAENGDVICQHKIGNTGINALTPIGDRDWILTTLDGHIECITIK